MQEDSMKEILNELVEKTENTAIIRTLRSLVSTMDDFGLDTMSRQEIVDLANDTETLIKGLDK